jgi:hypothetical protein
MKSPIQKTLMQGIKDLHIKILQSESATEIGHYMQEILDTIMQAPVAYQEKLRKKYWKELNQTDIINMLKNDIKSFFDGAYSRIEIAKHKATMNIVLLKKLFTDPLN